MMMEQLTALLVQYGLLLVFANVFLVQAGVPVPAVPTMLVAGALAVGGGPSVPMIIGVAVLGSMLGDGLWYIAGRIYGMRVLKLLCRSTASGRVKRFVTGVRRARLWDWDFPNSHVRFKENMLHLRVIGLCWPRALLARQAKKKADVAEPRKDSTTSAYSLIRPPARAELRLISSSE